MADHGVKRKLAAIMAADVVGYSRMMGEDETGTLDRLKAVRGELFNPLVEQHGGRIVKLTGDGALTEFPSVVEATRCAMAIQSAMETRNAGIREDHRILFRIGVNLGDVIVEGDDIYGDGVNLAARLEAQAEPGGICLSAGAFEQVRAKLDLQAEDMGELRLKNIALPVRAYRVWMRDASAGPVPVAGAPRRIRRWTGRRRVAGAVLAVLGLAAIAAAAILVLDDRTAGRSPPGETVGPVTPDGNPAIAVLPFDNLSGDAEQDYFTDGMTEDLITDLSRVSGLFVIARNSTFTYKGRAVKVQQVAEELGVDYVLEGSVRRLGDRVRINAQLVDARTGHHLWADRFDREITDVFALQDEVVRRIVSSLAVELTGREQKELTTAADVDPEAYDLLLRGLERFRRFTRETNAEARGFFGRATAIDPTYARAHADVALSLAMDVAFDWSEDYERTARQALKHATAALALDDTVHQVHFAVGNVYLFRKRHDEAIVSALRAIELDPSYADAHAFLGMAYNFAGQPEEGLASVRLAMKLNPRPPFFYVYIEGQALYQLGQFEEAIARFEHARDRNPAFLLAHQFLVASHAEAGHMDEAEWEVQEILALQPDLTLDALRERMAYKRPEDLERFLAALHKAGMPE